MSWQDCLTSLMRYRRNMGFALLAGMTMLGIQAALDPSVAALEPAELKAQPVVLSGLSPEAAEPSMDFVFRPLFSVSRRAAEKQTAPVPAAEIEIAAEAVQADMEGFVLLGVFASGGSEGVILRRKDGGRQRLYTGEAVDGWVLADVKPRSGEFAGPSGQRGILSLALATALPPLSAEPKAPAPTAASSAQIAPAESAQTEERLDPVTFNDIWEQRRRDAGKAEERPISPSDAGQPVKGGLSAKPRAGGANVMGTE